MKQERIFQLLLWIATALGLAAAIFVFVAHERNQPLAADELKIYAGEIRSTALSGEMLAELAEGGKLSADYFDNQCEFLQQNSDQDVQSLGQQQAEVLLQMSHRQTIGIGREVVEQLKGLCSSFEDSGKLSSSRDSLDNLAEQLEKLQQGL